MELSEQKIGQIFQEKTKYFRPAYGPISSDKPSLDKGPKDLPATIISLPQPRIDVGPNLWEVLLKRRSIRDYSHVPLPLEELANLLWATQGITDQPFSSWYRTAPSAGALHPIDTYLVVNRVEGLEAGIYFLHVRDFSLERKSQGDFSRQIARAALDQDMAREAAVVFVWVAVSTVPGKNTGSGLIVIFIWIAGISGKTYIWRLQPWAWGAVASRLFSTMRLTT